jgi:hypothetical protein
VSVPIALATLLLVGVAVLLVSAPLRAARRARGSAAGTSRAAGDAGGPREGAGAELAAAREAKYREIRDAELDYRTGKLAQRDYEQIDAQLRSEALEILDRIEAREHDDREGRVSG